MLQLRELPSTAELERRHAIWERAQRELPEKRLRADERNAAIRQVREELRDLDVQLELATERDAIQATRPDGCRCLGTGEMPYWMDGHWQGGYCPCPAGETLRLTRKQQRADEEEAALPARRKALVEAIQLPAWILRDRLSLTTFEPGPAQRAIHTKLLRAREAEPRSVLLHGARSRGKTGLLGTLLLAWVERTLRPGRFWSATALMDEITRQAHQPIGDEGDVLYSASHVPYLLIDDVDKLRLSTEFSIERLYELVNARYDRQLVTLVTSNLDIPALTAKLDGYIVDRFVGLAGGLYGGWVLELPGQNRRTGVPPSDSAPNGGKERSVSNPNPIVATGKIGDLAIKTGKPVEAKVVLYRKDGDWTIDDLIALQDTALLTIILQPQMVQRPMPMKEVEKKEPTFTIDGKVLPILQNTAEGYVLLGEELLELTGGAEALYQLVNEGWDDAADNIKWRPVQIAPGARITISEGDRFVTTLEEPSEPVFYIDSAAIELHLGDDGREDMTGERLLALAFGGPLWIEVAEGEPVAQVDPDTTYSIAPGIRFLTTAPEAKLATIYVDDKPFPVEPDAEGVYWLHAEAIPALVGAEQVWKLVQKPDDESSVPIYGLEPIPQGRDVVRVTDGDRFTTQSLDGDGSSNGPSAEANEEPVAGARRRGR